MKQEQRPIRKVTEKTAQQISACQLYTDHCDIVWQLVLYALSTQPSMISLHIANNMIRLEFDRVVELEEVRELFVRKYAVQPSEEWSQLAYISNVCALQIRTQDKGNDERTIVLDVATGEEQMLGIPIIGTIVLVRDLFKGFPVRQFYLETTNQNRLVKDLMTKLAILDPTVKFVVRCNNAVALESIRQPSEVGEIAASIRGLCGLFPHLTVKDFVVHKDDVYTLITLKAKTVKTECWMLSVNNALCEFPSRLRRLIRKTLAVRSLVVLKLNLPQTAYEIYKREVWFYDLQSIEENLASIALEIKSIVERERSQQFEEESTVRRFEQLTTKYYRKLNEKVPPQPLQQETRPVNLKRMKDRIDLKTDRIKKTQDLPHSQQDEVSLEAVDTIVSSHPNSRLQTSFARLSHMECLGQYAKGFFVAVLDGSLFLIDQHAASQKVLFEQYLAEPVQSHSCIFELSLPKEYLSILDESAKAINALGWQFELLCESQSEQFLRVKMLRTPFKLKFSYGKQEFIETLDHLRKHSNSLTIQPSQIQKIAAKLACSNSYKVQDIVDVQSMHQLIQSMSIIASPQTCPHGRPTISELDSIQKLSQRITCSPVYSL